MRTDLGSSSVQERLINNVKRRCRDVHEVKTPLQGRNILHNMNSGSPMTHNP